jgi:hypothetical protein
MNVMEIMSDNNIDNDSDNGEFDDLEGWLADQDGAGAELWNPDVGGILVGTFLRYEQRFSPKIGGECQVAIIEDRTRQLHAVWLSRSVLAGEYERQDPHAGDAVGHKYHGLKQGRGGGQPYHNYTVNVRRARPGLSQVITTAPPSTPPTSSSPSSPPLPPPPSMPTPTAPANDDELPW